MDKRRLGLGLRDGDARRETDPLDRLPAQIASRWLVRYEYERSDLVRVFDRSGTLVREYGYAAHLLVHHRDAAGLYCAYEYDRLEPAGRVISQIVDGAEQRFKYEPGRTILTDALGRQTIYHYSGRARPGPVVERHHPS